MENLKQIEELPDYLIGPNGELWSNKHKKFMKWGNSNDYLGTSVTINGRRRDVKQHHIVYKYHNDTYKLFQRYSQGVIDHINSIRNDNRIENLRLITFRKNISKEKSIKSGLPVGVFYIKKNNNYKACIQLNKKLYHLGTFDNIEEASLKYQNTLNDFNNYKIVP